MNSFYSVHQALTTRLGKCPRRIKMAHIKILSPKVEEFVLVVSIPLETPMVIICNQSIDDAELSFISKRDKESNHSKKVEYDRARALLKWANCCNARLVEMHNANHELKVYLGFATMEHMTTFHDSLAINVNGATMR